jgi:DNA polymerase III delta prime subunit
MARFFNTAGPCNPAYHYMLPPEPRIPDVRRLVDQMHYFVIHAPRQVGKTTSIRALARALTEEGRYAAVWVSAEQGQALRDDIGAAERVVLGDWLISAQALPEPLRPPPWPEGSPGERIRLALTAWAQACPRPLVVFIDEIDALRDDTLLSVLRQIRAGYPHRPELFPWSLALVGLRDVRDYTIAESEDGRLGTASPFNRRSKTDGPQGRPRSGPSREARGVGLNIKVESLTMSGFSRDDIAALYDQHTEETGQRFEPAAIDHAFVLTGGQPWLVNALAREIVERLRPDRTQPVTSDDMDRAARVLVDRQDTHLDSLSARLREPRIRALIEPMLAGETLGDVPEDDRRFAIDLGLVRREDGGGLVVANPIYREIIVRALASGPQDSLPRLVPTWLDAEGRLDPEALCEAFMAFWRQHGDAMLASAPYTEVAAQLVLMAFLHRVINGGGFIEREYAIGRGRIDLCLRLGDVTMAMELKAWRDGRPDPRVTGLEQLDRYLDGLGLQTGWLVIFDQRERAERTAARTRREQATSPAGRQITVVWA